MTAYDDLSDDARNLMAGFSELDIAEIAVDAQRAVTTLDQRLATAEKERDGAYRERAQLLAWLAALYPAVLAPAPDVDEPGWQILYVEPAGLAQLSWHIAPRDAELLAHVEQVQADDERARWDGHSTEEKYQRIASLTADLAQRCGPECAEMHTYEGRCELASHRRASDTAQDPAKNSDDDPITAAIKAFDFSDYGLDETDPTSEYAEWVPVLARAIRVSLGTATTEA